MSFLTSDSCSSEYLYSFLRGHTATSRWVATTSNRTNNSSLPTYQLYSSVSRRRMTSSEGNMQLSTRHATWNVLVGALPEAITLTTSSRCSTSTSTLVSATSECLLGVRLIALTRPKTSCLRHVSTAPPQATKRQATLRTFQGVAARLQRRCYRRRSV